MKRLASLIALALLLPLFTVQAFAVTDIRAQQSDAYGVSELESAVPEEAYEIWGNVTVNDAAHPQSLLQSLWQNFSGSSTELFSSAMHNAAEILLLCFLVAAVQMMPMDGGQARLCSIIGSVSLTLICTREAAACVPLGFHTIETLSSFSEKLLPALCAAATAGGAVTSVCDDEPDQAGSFPLYHGCRRRQCAAKRHPAFCHQPFEANPAHFSDRHSSLVYGLSCPHGNPERICGRNRSKSRKNDDIYRAAGCGRHLVRRGRRRRFRRRDSASRYRQPRCSVCACRMCYAVCFSRYPLSDLSGHERIYRRFFR